MSEVTPIHETQDNTHPWRWVLWIFLFQTGLAGSALWMHGMDEGGWHVATRDTARFGALLFLVIFLASTLRRISKNGLSSWLLRHRRYLGVGFAAAMGIHLICIFGIYFTQVGWVKTLKPFMAVSGGIGYLFIAAMALTSTDRSVRRLGAKNWKRLHRSGIYYLWIVFFFTYANGSRHSNYHAILAGAFALALLIKLGCILRVRRPATSPQVS